MPTLLYLLIAYLIGSAGLYLVLPSFRRQLHGHGSGNTSVLHGLQTGQLIPAVANLSLEILKPIAIVQLGYALGIDHGSTLLWGIVAATLGRMFPLYLGFRHGGKGAMTGSCGTIMIYPSTLWIGLALLAVVLVVNRLWKPAYRRLMSVWYALIPLIGYVYLEPQTVPPLASIAGLMLVYGRIRPEDADQIGFQRAKK